MADLTDLTASEMLKIKKSDLRDTPLFMFFTTIDDWVARFPVPDPRNVPPAWEASHDYLGATIIEAIDPVDFLHYLWYTDGAGTSDVTLPVFDHTATPVTDGTATWILIGQYIPD